MSVGSRIFVLVLLGCLLPGVAGAQILERLVMPGRVVEAHAETESNCGSCHAADTDEAVSALCVACHEDVGNDLANREGFHGRFMPARESECVACHTDHEGRDADIVQLNGGVFDHDFTDFTLGGRHSEARCDACHAEGDAHHSVDTTCGSCHSDDDVHDGQLGQDCGSCHGDVTWSSFTFDHTTTGYSLTGAHIDTACSDCHQDNRFENTPRACNTCHAIDDVHSGSKGTQCQDCHSTSTWQSIGFDHFSETGFALLDGHSGLACTDCHTRQDYKDVFSNGCIDCHLTDDDHQGRNGEDCSSCHAPTIWQDSSFDHGETGFHLVEAHAQLNCTSCHKASPASEVATTCSSCHAMDDTHGGQMSGECSSCHTQTAWHTSVSFDHDLSSFPLTGLHAVAACGSCHASNRFEDADTACVSCHADDDTHKGSLGSECASCHTSNGWAVTVFDHDVHTSFALEGGHAGLQCTDCHRGDAADASDVPSTCGGCHANDDVHDGQFGTGCGQCHNVNAFGEVESL